MKITKATPPAGPWKHEATVNLSLNGVSVTALQVPREWRYCLSCTECVLVYGGGGAFVYSPSFALLNEDRPFPRYVQINYLLP